MNFNLFTIKGDSSFLHWWKVRHNFASHQSHPQRLPFPQEVVYPPYIHLGQAPTQEHAD